MATMKRNVNLEEIATDAFMGISFLRYQTLKQKIIFIGSLVVAAVSGLVCALILHLNSNIITFISLVPIVFGVLFGANYNEDFSVFRYLVMSFSNPVIKLVSMPFEDMDSLRKMKQQLEDEAAVKEQTKEGLTPELMRRFYIIIAISIVAFIGIIAAIILVKKYVTAPELHHTVNALNGMRVMS